MDPDEEMLKSIDRVARAIRDLGTGNAATPMGALECHALAIKEAASEIAGAIRELAEAIREAG